MISSTYFELRKSDNTSSITSIGRLVLIICALGLVLHASGVPSLPRTFNDTGYIYDSLHRLTEIHYADKVIRFTYDAAGNRASTTVEILTTPPSISSLSPNIAVAGGAGLTVTVNGSNFSPTSTVQWNGFDRTTTFINSSQLQAVISVSDIASSGSVSVTVLNQTSSLTSNSQVFSVTPTVQDTVPVSIPDSFAQLGTIVTIPIEASNLDNKFARMYAFDLRFNPAVLQPAVIAFDSAGTLSAGMTITADTSTPGALKIEAFRVAPMAGTGTLLNLRFNVVGDSEEGIPLAWQYFYFNEGDIFSNAANGLFYVVSPTAASVMVSGRVLRAGGRPIARAMVTMIDQAGRIKYAVTNQFGYYRFAGVRAGETYTFTVYAKNRFFTTPSIVRTVEDEITELNFVAAP